MKFYVCEHCGNIIQYVKDKGVPVMCCGQKMKELIPGVSDGAHEKHVPAVKVEGNKVIVEVGSVEHPMLDVHYIRLQEQNSYSLMVTNQSQLTNTATFMVSGKQISNLLEMTKPLAKQQGVF